MPEVDVLMQEWPTDVEEILREVNMLFCRVFMNYDIVSISCDRVTTSFN